MVEAYTEHENLHGGAYSDPVVAWGNITTSMLRSFKSYSGSAEVEVDGGVYHGSELRLVNPEPREVKDAIDLAETLGLKIEGPTVQGLRTTNIEMVIIRVAK